MMSNEKTSFEDQSVFITGAAQGIGAATARIIAERGGKVFAFDIDAVGLRELQKTLKLSDDQIIQIDVGSPESVKESIELAYARSGRVDALVNTVGIVGPNNTKVENVDWVDFERTFRINLFGATWGIRRGRRNVGLYGIQGLFIYYWFPFDASGGRANY